MHTVTSKREFIVFLFLVILATWFVGGIKMTPAARPSIDPNTILSSVIITPTPGPAGSDSTLQLQQIQIQTTTIGAVTGLHGAFIIATPEEVDLAHSLGVTYAINYNYGGGWANGQETVNPNSAVGKEMAKFGMKAYVGVNQFIDDNCKITNIDGVKALVETDMNSPLLAGYWIKDDGKWCSSANAAKTIYHTIRSIDTNPAHVVIAGYGEIRNMWEYEDGVADMLGLYPYPGYNAESVDKELQQMLAIIKAKTPAGKNPPPWIGIYQAFWSNNGKKNISRLPTQEVLNDVQLYMKYGASGVVAFSIGAPSDVNQTAYNDPVIQSQVAAVSNWLSTGIGK